MNPDLQRVIDAVLDLLREAGIPIVRVSIQQLKDRATWHIAYAPDATEQQRRVAAAWLDAWHEELSAAHAVCDQLNRSMAVIQRFQQALLKDGIHLAHIGYGQPADPSTWAITYGPETTDEQRVYAEGLRQCLCSRNRVYVFAGSGRVTLIDADIPAEGVH